MTDPWTDWAVYARGAAIALSLVLQLALAAVVATRVRRLRPRGSTLLLVWAVATPCLTLFGSVGSTVFQRYVAYRDGAAGMVKAMVISALAGMPLTLAMGVLLIVALVKLSEPEPSR